MLCDHRHDCFYIKRLTMYLECENSTSMCKHNASSGSTLSANIVEVVCVCCEQKHWAANLTHNVPCKLVLSCSLRTNTCCWLPVESYFYLSAHIWNWPGTCNPDKSCSHCHLVFYDQMQKVVNVRVKVQFAETESSSENSISIVGLRFRFFWSWGVRL